MPDRLVASLTNFRLAHFRRAVLCATIGVVQGNGGFGGRATRQLGSMAMSAIFGDDPPAPIIQMPQAGEAAMAALSLVRRPSYRHNLLKNVDAFCRTARPRCSLAHCTNKAFRMRERPDSTEQSSTEQ
jgi:hypothetical protein